ncbi:DNA-binding protein [Comamonas sp. GB3 AK4-5]|uniref:DNA-binding protein n=1 Tax=Comamonas sp. GB3 AK4-5 TaxID=3231487 RepID=UPI00351F0D9D
MNTAKSPRGIQEADVWAAADALIAQGLRPTIERVRQHIGRGSPNTVSPLLEGWFATLGPRLGVSESAQAPADDVPEPVRQAALQMWQAALEQSKQAAQLQLQEREALIAGAEKTLAANEQHLVQREEAMHQQKKAMDEAMKLARSQAQELSRRLDEMQQLLQERESSIQALRLELTAKLQQREADQQQHAEALQAAAGERQRLVEQFAGNERRMLADLDRARQDLAAQKKQQSDGEKRALARHEELHLRFVQSEEALVQARGGQLSAEQALRAAQERVADLKALAAARDPQLQAPVAADAAARLRSARPAAPRRGLPAKTLRKNRR